MKIHEYQAKQLLKQYGIPIPVGNSAETVEECSRVAALLNTQKVVIKAQIHAGGRGKGGGIKLAASPDEIVNHASRILGMQLVTPQTGPQGRLVKKVLIEEAQEILKEYYVAVVLDRKSAVPVLITSAAGGMEIEEVSAKHPELIIKTLGDPGLGLSSYKSRLAAFQLGLNGKVALEAAKLFENLYRLFVEKDASLAEINPLVLVKDGRLLALDAKINFDDSALPLHPDIATFRDLSEEEPLEVQASLHHLNYIKLNGAIGCMVNGAGLAMATMDIIKLYGGEPANFLDVGGGASEERVTEAFKIILSDPSVKAVLVNIFGGIVRCDLVASGIVAAAKKLSIGIPIIVRLKGTNREQGECILKQSGLVFEIAENMDDAAIKVVKAAIH